MGFDGGHEEWKQAEPEPKSIRERECQEYRLICEGLGRTPAQGIDAASFFRLVNEDSEGKSTERE